MDTGPTAFFYRTDIFDKAGLPVDPDAVHQRISTWEAWIDFGKELKAKTKVLIETSSSQVYNQILNASTERHFDEHDQPIYADSSSAVAKAFRTAAAAAKAGIVGRGLDWNSGNAALGNGSIGGHVEAVWWGPTLKQTAPNTKGRWSIAQQPVRPGNSGGSFLAIPHTCKDPDAAWKFISWLTTPEHQVQSFQELQLFPSCPASLESPKMNQVDPLFGGLNITKTFYTAAKQVPVTYYGSYESVVSTPFNDQLVAIETSGKDPAVAWNDAIAQANRQLAKRGMVTK